MINLSVSMILFKRARVSLYVSFSLHLYAPLPFSLLNVENIRLLHQSFPSVIHSPSFPYNFYACYIVRIHRRTYTEPLSFFPFLSLLSLSFSSYVAQIKFYRPSSTTGGKRKSVRKLHPINVFSTFFLFSRRPGEACGVSRGFAGEKYENLSDCANESNRMRNHMYSQ